MLLHILYLIGITAEAMTGALAAGRRRMDTFGVIIIATATALGGGSVRDILWNADEENEILPQACSKF